MRRKSYSSFGSAFIEEIVLILTMTVGGYDHAFIYMFATEIPYLDSSIYAWQIKPYYNYTIILIIPFSLHKHMYIKIYYPSYLGQMYVSSLIANK